jgi:hypothetical protein
VVVARDQRRPHAYTPQEIRDRLHARHAQTPQTPPPPVTLGGPSPPERPPGS